MYMPMWDPTAESLVTGPSQDDHDGGPAAGVASGFDPSGGEPAYQFGNQWVSRSQICMPLFDPLRERCCLVSRRSLGLGLASPC